MGTLSLACSVIPMHKIPFKPPSIRPTEEHLIPYLDAAEMLNYREH